MDNALDRKTVLFLSDHYPFDTTEPHPVWGDEPKEHKFIGEVLTKIFGNIIYGNSVSDILKYSEEIDFIVPYLYNGDEHTPWAYKHNQWFTSAAIAELLNIPCMGSNSSILVGTHDKHLQKQLLRRLGIPTPSWMVLCKGDEFPKEMKFEFPCIVKWRWGHSSFFIEQNSVVHNYKEAVAAIGRIKEYTHDIIIEEYVPGTNLTVGAIGGETCTVGKVIQIDTADDLNLQTFSLKYQMDSGRKKTIVSNHSVISRVEEYTNKIFEFYKPFDFMRVDFRYDEKQSDIKVVEHNIHSNFEFEGSFHVSLSRHFATYEKLLTHMINLTIKRFKD